MFTTNIITCLSPEYALTKQKRRNRLTKPIIQISHKSLIFMLTILIGHNMYNCGNGRKGAHFKPWQTWIKAIHSDAPWKILLILPESEELYSERNVRHSQLFSQLCKHDAQNIHFINGNYLVIYLLPICFYLHGQEIVNGLMKTLTSTNYSSFRSQFKEVSQRRVSRSPT